MLLLQECIILIQSHRIRIRILIKFMQFRTPNPDLLYNVIN
jgi:hypothetical protein